jgi:hypothetical protein
VRFFQFDSATSELISRPPPPSYWWVWIWDLPHFDAELEELGLLAQTAGMEPVARVACKRKAPDAALFVGRGKADEIKALAEEIGASESPVRPVAQSLRSSATWSGTWACRSTTAPC